jgi:hypothetical protein
MKVIDGMYLMVPVTARLVPYRRYRDCTGSGIEGRRPMRTTILYARLMIEMFTRNTDMSGKSFKLQ